jgi:hypothetical protein
MVAMTPDDVRQVRTMIPDTEAVFDGQTMFTDQEIKDYIAVGNGSVLRAAGYANLAIATSEALISKKIRTQDLQTDGAALANALINKANALFARADKEDAAVDGSYYQIVNYGWGTYPPELTEYETF